MKVHQWINKYNYRISSEILKKYSLGRQSGRSPLYVLHFSFWDKYALRLLLVLSAAVTIKKDAYQAFFLLFSTRNSAFDSPENSNIIYLKIRDLIATLFGFRYFVFKEILPLKGINEILKSKISIEGNPKPLVSIIIEAKDGLAYIYNCLKSIEKTGTSSYPIEVIVVDSSSDDQYNVLFQKNIEGLTYLRNSDQQTHSLNSVVAYARGEFICILNNNIQVQEKWLDPLVQTFENPEVGCAGSKILYKNGLLKEAGVMICQNLSAEAYGKYAGADHPHYNYIRESDGVTKCLLFRKADMTQVLLSGNVRDFMSLDAIDICFGMRHLLHKKIIYQPLSKVIDTGDIYGLQDVLVNKQRFAQRWKNELLSYHSSGDPLKDARKYHSGKTILFIDNSIPTPDKDSGSNRLFKIMKIVKSLGYHVIFLPNDGKKRGHYSEQMIAEGFELLYGFPNRRGMVKILIKMLPVIDIVWLCKADNRELFNYIYDHKKDCSFIYDTIDLHFLRFQREGDLTKESAILQLAQETKKTELQLAKQADITIAITQDEMVMLKNELIGNVVVIPNIHESIIPHESTPGFEDRTGILFIGGYFHKPNVDAANWLAEEIMPEVWKINPSVKLTLLGSNPTEEILALQSERINVPGYVKDVSAYFYHHRIFVAPLRYGAGMKGKVGQSLEYGLPIVSTGIGVEGMDLRDGIDVMVGDNTSALVTKIIELYESPTLWATIRNNSSHAIEQYSPENVTAKIKHLFEILNTIK